MINKELISLALKYRKSGLWRSFREYDLIAVKLESGETAYVTLFGNEDIFLAVNIYVGQKQLNSLYMLISYDYSSPEYMLTEVMHSQDCLQVMFVSREDLAEKVRAVCEEIAFTEGADLSGNSSYPVFLQYRPDYETFEAESENGPVFEKVLNALILLSEKIHDQDCEGSWSGLCREGVPLFSIHNGELISEGYIRLPEYTGDNYPEILFTDELARENMRRIKGRGEWHIRLATGVISVPQGEYYVFPRFLMIYSKSHDSIVRVNPSLSYQEVPEEILDNLSYVIQSDKIKPREIKVKDKRTYLLLKSFCSKSDIKLTMRRKQLPELESIVCDTHNFFSNRDNFDFPDENDSDAILERILVEMEYLRYDAPDELIELLPYETINSIRGLISDEKIPYETAEALKRRLNILPVS